MSVIVDHRGNPIRSAPQRKRLTNTEPVARSGNLQRAVRGFPRDRPMGYTIAPQPARQIWELHRIREESRQQSLVSPHFSGFLEWVKTQVVGFRPFGLRFPSLADSERDRLRDPALYVRDRWREYQDAAIGVRDETLAELVGQCLDWMLIDGDCFVIPERRGGEMRYRGYPGDALAETSHTPGTIGRDDTPQRALGIEVDSDGRPRAYFFGQRARFRSLGYTSWSTQVDELAVPADLVWHIRDRRRHGGAVRGWPKLTAAFEYIARLNEFDQAFVRAAIRRVGAAIALKRTVGATLGDYDRDGEEDAGETLAQTRIEGAGRRTDESVKPYQESEAEAGSILELDPGYERRRPSRPVRRASRTRPSSATSKAASAWRSGSPSRRSPAATRRFRTAAVSSGSSRSARRPTICNTSRDGRSSGGFIRRNCSTSGWICSSDSRAFAPTTCASSWAPSTRCRGCRCWKRARSSPRSRRR